ncbi:MAG: hypothetical protein ACSLFP_01590 [Acidimicrobiales bacterium]
MDAPGSLGEIDLISPDQVTALAAVEGPCISVLMPTHRHGPETLQGPVRLRNLIDEAARALADLHDVEVDADELLTPMRALVDDADFWQHQGDGLALFSGRGHFSRFRLPLELIEEVHVGSSFRVAPITPMLSGDGRFFLLALSQSSVRLFVASRHRIAELDLGAIPASMEEALVHEDPEKQLQMRSGPVSSTAAYHGHGIGDEVDKAAVGRFVRAVATGLEQHLGSTDQPVVLASVGYYLPMLRAATSLSVVDAVVEGNPEHRSAEDLHAAAWPLVEPSFAEQGDGHRHRYGDAKGTGMAVAEIGEVSAAAAEGRVDTLFVAPAADRDPRIDRAVLDTLTRRGHVVAVDLPVDGDGPLAALLRY